ncbi:MAG: lysoplasmalogenase [Paracoccaceae bacterium]|nr:MAG: lysoplasmalogenase [Paracoccaceae bacterium]
MPLAALAAAVLAALYQIRFAGSEASGALRSVVKTLAVALLALAAWWGGAVWTVTLGLALGALGDLALSRPGERWFLAGMAAFTAGHLAYVVAFAGVAAGGGLPLPPVPPALALVILALSTEVWLAPRAGALRWPVRGYVVVIVLMGLAAMVLPEVPGRGWLMAGAASFILSDVILSLQIFVLTGAAARRAAGLALWPPYWGGQAMILAGALAAGGAGAFIGR